MKLLRCYVSSFGKLKDFSYDFSQGLNTIKQDNGWGKSTLATFIKAMFYGLNSTKRSVVENERLKYRPWNSVQKFGGYVVFLWGNNEYKIERFFGSKESEDEVSLFDERTGKRFNNTENLGKRIFEVDEEGFLSTTYFSQKEFQIKSNTSLTAKYNTICEVQDSEAFDNALLKLIEKAKSYKYRGDKGLISEIKQEISSIDLEIQKTIRSSETAKLLSEEINVLEEQTQNLTSDINKLTKEISRAGEIEATIIKKAHYEELLNKKAELQKEFQKINSELNGKVSSQEEINNYITCNQDLITVNTNVKILKENISELENINESQSKLKKSHSKILLLLCVLFAVCAIPLAFVNIYICIGCFLLSGVFLVPYIMKNKTSKSSKENSYEQILVAKRKELDKYLLLGGEISSTIDKFISQFNISVYSDRFSALNYISTLSAQYRNLNKSITDLDNKIREYDSEKINFSKDIDCDKNIKDLQEQLKFYQAEYNKKANVLANKKANLTYQENLSNSLIDLENKKEELVQTLQKYNEDYRILNLTAEYLKKADENLKLKYRAPLQESLNKYLEKINANKLDAHIDVDLNVSVQENCGEKIADYYSKGYQNLIEICKRFALTDVLFKQEKPFIILDDPFYNLDDDKLKNAIKLIKEISNEYQIIYLTCHESRVG